MAKTKKRKFLLPLFIGNFIEFYDIGLYGFLAPFIASAFFPSENLYITTIASMGTFAIGFLGRPIGGLVFGYIGDLMGRKICVSNTILFMSFFTIMIGLLPTYKELGVVAPILLITCRFFQGICTGGEYNNTAILLLEHQPKEKRGFYSGVFTASSIVGFFIASIAASICLKFNNIEYVWRIPFLLGGIIGFYGFYLRGNLIKESPLFYKISNQKLRLEHNMPLTIKSNLKNFAIIVTIGGLAGLFSLFFIGHLNSYLVNVIGFSNAKSLLICNLCLLLYMVLLPVFGYASDKFGQKTIMLFSSVLTMIFPYVIFNLISSGQLLFILAGLGILVLMASAFNGPMHALMIELFPVRNRCRYVSLGFSIGIAFFGGTAPVISSYFIELYSWKAAPCIIFMVCGAMGTIAILMSGSRFKSNNANALTAVQS